MAPVHCAAGSDGETNFGVTSLAAPKAASSRVARYSLTARLAVSGSAGFFPFPPGPEDCALTEALVAGARERRMIRDLVLDAQAAEPAICQVDLNFTTERPFRADREHKADNQHSNHKHWIDRWPA